MNSAVACCYPPVAQVAGRLLVAWPPFDPSVWIEIHEAVQGTLRALDGEVRSRVPSVQVAQGKTSGRHFELFSYRTFARSDAPEIDPVVAGLILTRSHEDGERIAIDADLSGESSGNQLLIVPRQTVLPIREKLLDTAQALAKELARHPDLIAAALEDRPRSIG